MKRIEQFIYIQTFIHIRTVAHNIKNSTTYLKQSKSVFSNVHSMLSIRAAKLSLDNNIHNIIRSSFAITNNCF
jgi:hypothetical protein